MRHFVGGFAIGFILAVVKIPSIPTKTWAEKLGVFLAHVFVGTMFGLAAWGLLP